MSFEGFEETRQSRLSVLLLWQDFIWRGYYTTMRYLSEFSTFKHHLTLDSNLFTCCLKGSKRREDHVFLFFCYGNISFGGGITQSWDILVSSPLLSIILRLILTYLYVIWRVRGDERITHYSCNYSLSMYSLRSYKRESRGLGLSRA
jgi:hypothetical protein